MKKGVDICSDIKYTVYTVKRKREQNVKDYHLQHSSRRYR